jgi:hypothetical protein
MKTPWRNDSRGNLYAVDYSVGDNPQMLSHTLKITNPVSLEGHINSALAELHDIPYGNIHIYQVVRHGE